MHLSDTIAAIATPPGQGGIAIIRLSGPDALRVAARVFLPADGADPCRYGGYTVHYGRFREAAGGDLVDDGLLTCFRAPRSYTGEDCVELSCHGGRVTTAALLRATTQCGARLAEPGEFTQRAFLNGRLDLAQAEAVADIIRAKTESAQRAARRQLDGALSAAVQEIRSELIGALAAIEVTIDFSEEVGDLEYAPLIGRIERVRSAIGRLLAGADRGRILRDGVRVALAGRPNVGKSSLFNALLRDNRAIVADLPGTTRDRLDETLSLEGVPFVLSDAAGLRETNDVVERVGVERAELALAQSDVALFVLDARDGITGDDRNAAARLHSTDPDHVLVVLNKIDLVAPAVAAAGLHAAAGFVPCSAAIGVSAQTGEGVPELESALLRMALGEEGAGVVMFDSVLVTSARHRDALETAEQRVQEAESTATAGLPGDFIAIDLRGALDALGLITGETVTDQIVHRIFQDFCVGK